MKDPQTIVTLAVVARMDETNRHCARAVGLATRKNKRHPYWIDGRRVEFRPIGEYFHNLPLRMAIHLARDADVVEFLPWWARTIERWTR